MHVLITGASGLIGGRLARHLGASGYDVVLASRNPDTASLPKDLPCVAIDLEDENSLDRACNQIDVVVHAAGMNAAECQRDPEAAFRVNASGTERLANAAQRRGVRKFIYLSTAHVYRSPLAGFISERSETINPHPYATSQLAGEASARAAAQTGSMAVVALRLSNAFGAPVHPDVNCWKLLAQDLCRQWSQSRTLTLATDGSQQRDFTTITAVCLTIERLLGTNSGSATYNLGGQSCSVLEMASRIQARAEILSDTRPELALGISRTDDAGALLYHSDCLRDLVGPVPQDTNAEIDALLLFCQSHFGAGR